jgi:hypothetical protein
VAADSNEPEHAAALASAVLRSLADPEPEAALGPELRAESDALPDLPVFTATGSLDSLAAMLDLLDHVESNGSHAPEHHDPLANDSSKNGHAELNDSGTGPSALDLPALAQAKSGSAERAVAGLAAATSRGGRKAGRRLERESVASPVLANSMAVSPQSAALAVIEDLADSQNQELAEIATGPLAAGQAAAEAEAKSIESPAEIEDGSAEQALVEQAFAEQAAADESAAELRAAERQSEEQQSEELQAEEQKAEELRVAEERAAAKEAEKAEARRALQSALDDAFGFGAGVQRREPETSLTASASREAAHAEASRLVQRESDGSLNGDTEINPQINPQINPEGHSANVSQSTGSRRIGNQQTANSNSANQHAAEESEALIAALAAIYAAPEDSGDGHEPASDILTNPQVSSLEALNSAVSESQTLSHDGPEPEVTASETANTDLGDAASVGQAEDQSSPQEASSEIKPELNPKAKPEVIQESNLAGQAEAALEPEPSTTAEAATAENGPAPSRTMPHAVRALISQLKPAEPVLESAIEEKAASPAATPDASVDPSADAAPEVTQEPEPPQSTERMRLAPPKATQGKVGVLETEQAPLEVPMVAPGSPDTPPLDLAPDHAPLVEYSPLKNNPLRPAAPSAEVSKQFPDAHMTLHGPMLSAGLVRFRDHELMPVLEGALRPKKKSSWLTAVLVSGMVFAGAYAGVSNFLPKANEEAERNTRAEIASRLKPATANPLAKQIEVTGLRIVPTPEGKADKAPEIQYLVVNHGSTAFPDSTIFVTLWPADAKPGEAPLTRFSFAAEGLGAYQAKEMHATIERMNRPVELPEWEDLRVEVEIAQ